MSIDHYESDGTKKNTSRLYSLLRKYAYENKEITLASGQKSNVYLDCRQVYLHGEAQYLLGEILYALMKDFEKSHEPFDGCGGMAMGAIPLSCALSAASFRRGHDFFALAVRKEKKNHGMNTTIEGIKAVPFKANILVLEDVVTTASSAIRAITELRQASFTVDTLFCIVDRLQGGREALKSEGVTMKSIFTLKDFLE